MFTSAGNLKWIQACSAGVERFLLPEVVASSVILTNAKGVYATPCSDHVIAMLLMFARRMNKFVRFQSARKWQKLELDELQGKSVGIIGLGSIGREIERKAKCFGVNVIGLSRGERRSRDSYSSELEALLKQSDFVVLSTPLTKGTSGIIGKDELALMKRTAFLINIGRGQLIRERELVMALKERKIAGAALDVFEEEPLPPSSELWDMENVIITPHVAGDTKHMLENTRICNIFCENLKRYASGNPLINIVDKQAGY
jgi:phosphoglycerate dehydrogenase-like enzyme